MSWDVVIFNSKGDPPPPPESMDEEFLSPPFGCARDVRKIISLHLPEVDWSDPAWGVLEGETT